MRGRMAVLLPWITSCALVSGLSQIAVENDSGLPAVDASADTTMEAMPVDSGTDARDALPDAMLDAAIDVSTPSIACGMSKCTPSTQECCRTDSGGGYLYACANSQQQICSGLAIPCDDSRDCAMQGTVCCAFYVINGNQGMADKVECVPSANCTMQSSGIVLCDPNVANSCPSGTCTLSTFTLPGYYFCK